MIYLGDSCFSKALEPVNWTFEQLADSLKEPIRFSVTLKEFLRLPRLDQTRLKNNRYFIPAEVRFPERVKKHALSFNFFALDIDSDPSFMPELLPVDYNWVLYSTAKHSCFNPRYRVVVQVEKRPYFDYERFIKSFCDQYKIKTSAESYNIVLPMFFPKIPIDSKFVYRKNITGNIWKPVSATNNTPEPETIIERIEQPIFQEPPLKIQEVEIHVALSKLNPDCDYETWRNIGSAIKHQFQENDSRGYLIFDSWSKSRKSSKYNQGQTTRELYSALKPYPETGRPITFAYVFKLVKEQEEKLQKFLKKPEPKPVEPEPKPIEPQPVEPDPEPDNLEITNNPFFKKNIFNVFDNFIYVSQQNEYYDFVTRQSYKIPVLEHEFGHYFPQKVKVSHYLTRLDKIHRAYDYIYLPQNTPSIPPIKRINGVGYVNTFRKKSFRNIETKNFTFVKDTIDKHIDWLFPDDNFKQNMLKCFLAYPIKTCKRIQWAAVIQGVSGIGKTFIYQLLKAAVGKENISILDARHVTGNFNEWAASTQFVVIDELRRDGTFKFFDALRPNITNEDLSVEKKYQAVKSVENPSTYLMCTEHKTALKKDDTDRRYLPLWSPVNLETLQKHIQKGGFKDLAKICNNESYAKDIHNYFLNVKMVEKFNRNRPPTINESRIIASMSQESLEMIVEDIIETEIHPYVNKIFVAVHHLYDYMMVKYPKERFDMAKLVIIIMEMGYLKLKSRIQLDELRSTIYIKNTYKQDPITVYNHLKLTGRK